MRFGNQIVMASNSERLSEAGLAAVSAILGAKVNGTYANLKDHDNEQK